MSSEDRSDNDPGDNRSWIDKISELFSSTPRTREEVNELLAIARANKILGNDEFNIIEGAMEVSELQVSDVMVPRSQIIMVSHQENLQQLLTNLIKSGHSRFPVFGETPDDILGILHAKDLLPLIIDTSNDTFELSRYMRPVYKVPESKRLNKMLKSFRETRNHMAIVIDEYGSVSGLITIEDVLEEIVGEIEDEFDVEQDAPIKQIGDGDYIIKAHLTIEDFNEHFEAQLDDSDFDTIAG
ncbi:MAG: CBS domain-containing protein, partial [Pseudomonadales bacterium]|nr:CBS domain-containing protein [Pseudomonadales bacterium]